MSEQRADAGRTGGSAPDLPLGRVAVVAVDIARHGIIVNALALDKVRAYQSNHYALPAGGWYRTTKRWTNQPLLVQHLEPAGVNEGRPKPVQ